MTIREIQIDPSLNLTDVFRKAEKLAARAVKKGLSGGFKVTTETRIKTSQTGEVFEVSYLIIEGEPVKFNGWTFVGVVEWVNDQPVVTGSPYYEGASVDRSVLVKGGCDHCGFSRQRKSVIVVENEAGERKQVGKQCVKDYLGTELAVSWFDTKDPFAEFSGFSGSGVQYYSFSAALTWAATIVRVKGFVPSRDDERTTTVSLVRLALGQRPSNYYGGKDWDELQELPKPSDAVTGAEILKFAKNLTGDSDYVQNVKAVIGETSEFFNPKFLGLVVSLAGGYAREVVKAAEEIADPVVEGEFGSVGERITVTLKAVSSTAFETQYGTTFANIFTGEGYRFKWLTGTRSFEAGDVVTVKATIKGYDEYKGRKFTVLTRCKDAG
jgi:hypothetical protein